MIILNKQIRNFYPRREYATLVQMQNDLMIILCKNKKLLPRSEYGTIIYFWVSLFSILSSSSLAFSV